jgi:hypothetical protein
VLIAIAGIAFASCGHAGSGRPIALVALNDAKRTVEVGCGVDICGRWEPAILAPGQSHTWQTTEGDGEQLHVYLPHNHSLGCLLKSTRAGDRFTFRVSELEECVT